MELGWFEWIFDDFVKLDSKPNKINKSNGFFIKKKNICSENFIFILDSLAKYLINIKINIFLLKLNIFM